MRRFIVSLTGKVVSQLVILALLLPYLSLTLATRASAQVQLLPSWAVVEFKNLKAPGTKFGQVAADSVASELARTNQYDVVAKDTVNRAVTTLGLTLPLQGTVNLLRVAQEVRAQTVVSGDIVDYRILNVAGGKQARVAMRLVAYDVASGLPVNGAAVAGESTIRPSDTSDETLINDAISQAGSQAVHAVQAQTLPTGTVLNTLPTSAFINQGTRTGFQVGQTVIITRGRTQVGTGRVSDVEPDQATITIERNVLGVQPGDRVRAIASIPDIPVSSAFTPNGEVRITKARRTTNSGLVTTLIVLGIVAALLGGGNANDTGVVADVKAEATLDETTAPAVKVDWRPNGFAKGNYQRAAWQVWRSDITQFPVAVLDGGTTTYIDKTTTQGYTNWTKFQSIGGITCANTGFANQGAPGTGQVTGLVPGRPYLYSVELVYALSQNDLPGNSTTSGGGSTGTTTGLTTGGTAGGTGGGTTGGGTAGGTTGGATAGGTGGGTAGTGGGTGGTAGTGGASLCYFISSRTTSKGYATPLNAPTPLTPASGQQVPNSLALTFRGSAGPTIPLQIEYIFQFSTSPDFPADPNFTFTSNPFRVGGAGSATPISTPVIDLTSSKLPVAIRTASVVFWRVGARNVQDSPGPVPDASGKRYIFSPIPQSFKRQVTP